VTDVTSWFLYELVPLPVQLKDLTLTSHVECVGLGRLTSDASVIHVSDASSRTDQTRGGQAWILAAASNLRSFHNGLDGDITKDAKPTDLVISGLQYQTIDYEPL